MITKNNPPEARYLISSLFLNRLAPSLNTSVTNDEAFCREIGWQRKRVTQIGAHRIDVDDLFGLLRSVASGIAVKSVRSKDGSELPVDGIEGENGSVNLKIGGAGYRFEQAALLSKDKNKRLSVFDRVSEIKTLPENRRGYWQERVGINDLSNEEFIALMEELENTPESVFQSVKSLLQTEVTTPSLFPQKLETLSALIGNPSPVIKNDRSPGRQFLDARQALISKGLAQALWLVGPSYAFHDEGLVHALGDRIIDGNGAIPDISPLYDPFSLALVFDLCLLRIRNEKFAALGARVLTALFLEESSEHRFEDFSIAVTIATDWLCECDYLKNESVRYRRLSAWTWAGFLTRLFGHIDFERSELRSGLARQEFRSTIVGLLDRQKAPFWRTEWTSADALRGQLLRRLQNRVAKIDDALLPSDWRDLLDRAFASQGDTLKDLYRYVPTPFEEFLSDEPLDTLPQDAFSAFGIGANDDPVEFLASAIIPSFTTKFTPQELQTVRANGEKLRGSGITRAKSDRVWLAIETVTHCAGVYRDNRLAEIGADLAHALTVKSKGKTAVPELLTILDCSSGFVDVQESYEFLRPRSERIAFSEIPKTVSRQCLDICETACRSRPQIRPYLGRAMAALRIAARTGPGFTGE